MNRVITRTRIQRFSYQSEILYPDSPFDRTTINNSLERAAWMFIPENALQVYQATVIRKGEEVSFSLGLKGFYVVMHELSYYYLKMKGFDISNDIARGLPLLKAFFARFVPSGTRKIIEIQCRKLTGGER